MHVGETGLVHGAYLRSYPQSQSLTQEAPSPFLATLCVLASKPSALQLHLSPGQSHQEGGYWGRFLGPHAAMCVPVRRGHAQAWAGCVCLRGVPILQAGDSQGPHRAHLHDCTPEGEWGRAGCRGPLALKANFLTTGAISLEELRRGRWFPVDWVFRPNLGCRGATSR